MKYIEKVNTKLIILFKIDIMGNNLEHSFKNNITFNEDMLPSADINNSEPWHLTLKRSSTPITYSAHKNKIHKSDSIDKVKTHI